MSSNPIRLAAVLALGVAVPVSAQESPLGPSIAALRAAIHKDYRGMFREQGGAFAHPFLTPGSQQYADVLWGWGRRALPYEQGSVLDYLDHGGMDGWVPIIVWRDSPSRREMKARVDVDATNMHKPCLAQHAAFLTRLNGGDAEWLRERFYFLQAFVNRYKNHQRHAATGLHHWIDDAAIGVDNDPATFMRPPRSSGSIYLNCMMYKELVALVYLCGRLNMGEIGALYQRDADELRAAIRKHCWDERDGFFYSVDLNLVPFEPRPFSGDPRLVLHSGYPRDYDCPIQRLDVWSGFLALWSGVATPEQARRVVAEHYRDERTFNAPFGVRTLPKLAKMYNVRAAGNPSLWTGPIWGVSNYLVFRGLVEYGFDAEARELAEKTIRLFARDLERFGALHEYYLPESGEPVLNRGFQNWNDLVLNMAAWYEGRPFVREF